MIEARIFLDSLDGAREVLQQGNAELNGKYQIHDTIYRNINTEIPLAEEFLRLRVIPENIWDEKAVILALKQTELRKLGKNSHIPIKIQFDVREEAEEYYEENLKDTYAKDFEFRRIGWQYFLPSGDVVDLEVIEDEHPSIEFKSETDAGMEKLLEKFEVKQADIIIGPSVLAAKAILRSQASS